MIARRRVFLQVVILTIAVISVGRISICLLYQTELQEECARQVKTAQILASLQEKELMLKEIHHRIKNSLKLISSLLSLQSNSIQDLQLLEAFLESENRIRSMALIHENLYQSLDLANVDIGIYIR